VPAYSLSGHDNTRCAWSIVTGDHRKAAHTAIALSRAGDFAPTSAQALVTWEWLQREEHAFGAFEITHYRPRERPNSVRIVHPNNGEEAWWPLFDETGEAVGGELATLA
jgi:hypothetical protein